jgi:hypothetical protein
MGVESERERINNMIQVRICFDQKIERECEHASCYAMLELADVITKGAGRVQDDA